MNDVAVNPERVHHARYTLKQRIGTGGQGEVWRARDVERNADVALKILHPATSELAVARVALEREHVINSRLDHPHILKVFAPEEARQDLLLPMELAMGGDLRQLRGAGYLAVVPVLIEVAEALAHAHERGVVHRDLKPGNVLFDARGSAKLADFGIAGTTPLAAGSDTARAASPFSASPQQLRGEPPVPADDIYGLGALAYELLSGRPPYYPRFDARRVQNEPVPELVPTEPIPPRLAALIRRMLDKDPNARPANMSEVAEALDASLNDTLSFEFETAEPPRDAEPAARTGTHPALVAAEAAPTAPTPQPPPAAPAGRAAQVPRSPSPPQAPTVAPSAPPPPDTPEPGALDGPALWDDLRLGPGPGLPSPIEPIRGGRWRLAWGVGAAAAATVVFYALTHPDWLAHRVAPLSQQGAAPGVSATAAAPAAPSAAELTALRAERAAFDRRFTALKARGAATWDANDLSAARDRAAESTGALDAGSVSLARTRLAAGTQLLDAVERAAPAAAPASPGKELAVASAPQGDAGAAAAAAATRDEAYARAAGEGFAALGAGRLAEARTAFDRAHAIRPNGPEALDGLRRVSAAEGTSASDTSLKTHAEELEAQERWDEAVAAYAAALREHPGLAFAQAGKARAGARAHLDHSLQGLLDQPEQLSDPAVRAQAAAWLANAQATTPAGPVLRSQIARLQILLPEYDKPVRVSLVSDSTTQVAILSVGSFGSFEHRDVDLKPGTYTVIGSRVGYRDVRREITVTPGDRQTVSVSCYDPI